MKNEKRQWYLIFSLLAAVVILPSVAMLWFVSRAAENEQMAIRQRLTDKYSTEVKKEFLLHLHEQINTSSEKVAQLYRLCVSADKAITSAELAAAGTIFDAVVLYSNSGNLAEPDANSSASPLFADELADPLFATAISLEFQVGDYQAAIEQYRLVANTNKELESASLLAQIRCLRKAGLLKDAIDTCLMLANSIGSEANNENIWYLRLLLAQIYAQAGRAELASSLRELAEISQYPVNHSLKAFILEELSSLTDNLPAEVAQNLKYEKTLVSLSVKYPTIPSGIISSNSGEYFALPLNQHIDGILPCCFISMERLSGIFSEITEKLSDDMVFVAIVGPDGSLFAGEPELASDDLMERIQGQETIFNYPLIQPFGDSFKIWLAFRPGVFSSAAGMYQNAYLWGAVLILLLSGGGGIIVVRMLSGQLRMNRLKNDFIATVSHELKTPLASTRMLIDTLRDGKYSDTKILTDYLAIISRENDRLCSLIDNFLSFSRMERGKAVFDRKEISVNHLIDEVVELFNHKNEKNIIFSVTKLPLDATIYADAGAMQTVLLNLLSNACKYSVNLPKEIGLRGEHKAGTVYLAVKDNGIGLTPAQKRKVFDRFWRADTSLTRQTEGTGIGLSIVKYILDAHGFEIEINSKPGMGSEFVVKIVTNS